MGGGNGNVGRERLVLTGLAGLLEGQSIGIRLGQSIIVGRSRKCEFSTRRSRRFLSADEPEQRRILDDRLFLKVSRLHVRITYLARDKVEIWDMSKNGTFVDGRKVDRLLLDGLDGLDGTGVEIRLAEAERFRLHRA